jgi:hypothetical protein
MAVLSRPARARPAIRWRGLSRCRLWVGLLGLGLCGAAAAATPEYQLKAVFLFRFAEFVEWPAQAFADAQAPLTICVLGEDPFGDYLDDTVRGEKVNDRPLLIRRLRELDAGSGCHILFISSSEHEQMKRELAALKGHSVLTVSDNDGFGRAGGMIGLALADNKIRLQINPEAARAADLKLSSKLLGSATIVGSLGE